MKPLPHILDYEADPLTGKQYVPRVDRYGPAVASVVFPFVL